MSMTVLLVAVFGLLSVSARPKPSFSKRQVLQSRVVGGSQVGKRLTRHLAHLIIKFKDAQYSSLCTATVIAPRWLLTAAHCFVGRNGYPSAATFSSYAFIGESSAKLRVENTVKRPYFVKSYFIHKKYKPRRFDHRNDIALVYLDRPIPKAKLSMVKLGRSHKSMPLVGTTVTTAGYGQLSEKGPKASHLMKASLIVKPFLACARREHPYFRQFLSAPIQVCAVSPGWPHIARTDTCYGDSGGPLFFNEKSSGRILQFALTSFGTSTCAKVGSVTWYTRVFVYYTDIHKKIRGIDGRAWKGFW